MYIDDFDKLLADALNDLIRRAPKERVAVPAGRVYELKVSRVEGRLDFADGESALVPGTMIEIKRDGVSTWVWRPDEPQ